MRHRLLTFGAALVAAVRRHLDAENALVGTGTACLAAGAWQIYPPAAFVVVGLILFWLGLGVPGLGSPGNPHHPRGS